MATATARVRRSAAVAPRREPRQNETARPVNKAVPRRSGDHKVFGTLVMCILLVACAAFALLVQRIAIMHNLSKADAVKTDIEKATLAQENLEAQVAYMAASPELQQRAAKALKMVPATDVNYIKYNDSVDRHRLAKDMRFFDKAAKDIRKFKVAQRAALAKKSTQTIHQSATSQEAATASPASPRASISD